MHPNRLWYPLCFFSFSLLLILVILPLTRQGMFLDGVLYAAIAKNLALGYGSLWQPFYSQTDFRVFYEHPPLAIYFQSLFFKLLGQEFRVEQLYCLLMAIGQFGLIAGYWLKKEKANLSHLALLLLLWLMTPLNLKYVNNHLEATLTLFTTLASLLLLIKTQSKLGFITQYFSSASMVLIAFFCNGPTAFFPLSIPLIQTFVERQSSWYEAIKKTMALVLMTSIILSLFYLLVPDALKNTTHYFREQLLPSTTGTRQLNLVGFAHLYIFNLYFRAYWLVSMFVFACLAIAAKIKERPIRAYFVMQLKNKNVLLFILLSLVSSLPVGVSHRQALSYIMQSAPFFTLAMMFLCFESVQTIINDCGTKPWLLKTAYYFSILCLITSLMTVFTRANEFNSHQAMIHDVKTIIPYCNHDEIISASHSIYYDWHTAAYFARNSMISVTPQPGNRFYLTLKQEKLPKNYHLVHLPLSYFNLAALN